MIRQTFAILLIVAASSAAADTLHLAHHYKATGEGPDGSKYSGDVTVEVTSDTTFSIHWDIDGTIYNGFGMRRNDILSAAFASDKAAGLAMYQVQGDGLEGSWTFKGESGVGKEHLTPVD